MKSSAYRTTPSFGLVAFMKVSKPCNPMLASRGEMTPPCGVPCSVGLSFPWNTKPAFNHPLMSSRLGKLLTMLRMDSWAMLSKNPLMSASRTQVSQLMFPNLTLYSVKALPDSILTTSSRSESVRVFLKYSFPFGLSVNFLLLPVRFCHARLGFRAVVSFRWVSVSLPFGSVGVFPHSSYLSESLAALRGIDNLFVNSCRCFTLVGLSDTSN